MQKKTHLQKIPKLLPPTILQYDLHKSQNYSLPLSFHIQHDLQKSQNYFLPFDMTSTNPIISPTDIVVAITQPNARITGANFSRV